MPAEYQQALFLVNTYNHRRTTTMTKDQKRIQKALDTIERLGMPDLPTLLCLSKRTVSEYSRMTFPPARIMNVISLIEAIDTLTSQIRVGREELTNLKQAVAETAPSIDGAIGLLKKSPSVDVAIGLLQKARGKITP